MKLNIIIFLLVFENLINSFSLKKDFASKIPSQAGEKLLISSEIEIPTLLCINAPASFKPSPSINIFCSDF